MDSQQEILSILGRERDLFAQDLQPLEAELTARIRESSFLVLGGAGSIGQAVSRAIFSRQPRRLTVVDISENDLVELVRDVRSSYGYIEGSFETLPLDIGTPEFEAFLGTTEPFDYVLNLSALKHVRSEKDPFTMMRMIQVNVLNTMSTLQQSIDRGVARYFAVSSDKAANPANAMGASKRVMELCLIRASEQIDIGSTRFANVAFSNGSLLHGFRSRLAKRQPLAAPEDVRRYFITADESAVLCLLSCLFGGNRESFIPKADQDFGTVDFRTIAERFLESQGYRAHPCQTEDEARERVDELAANRSWPCFFFSSDTTGEKEVEEFAMESEVVDDQRFREISVIRWERFDDIALDTFVEVMRTLRRSGSWSREDILGPLKSLLPEFQHQETGKFLDSKM